MIVSERGIGERGVFENWLQLLLTIAVTVSIAASLAVAAGEWQLSSHNQSDRTDRLQNRAAVCSVARNLRMQLPDVCLDPRVTRYYDVNDITGASQPSPALCAVAKHLDVAAPGCP